MERKILTQCLDRGKKQWSFETMEVDVGGFNALLFVAVKIAASDDAANVMREQRIEKLQRAPAEGKDGQGKNDMDCTEMDDQSSVAIMATNAKVHGQDDAVSVLTGARA